MKHDAATPRDESSQPEALASAGVSETHQEQLSHAKERQDQEDRGSAYNGPEPQSGDIAVKALQGWGTSELIDDVLETVYGESWSRSALWLAISAGPLTYIALQAGYLIGFGHLAPFHLFIYFAVFTLVAGLGGIVFRIYDILSRKHEKRHSRNALNTALESLPDILALVRNLRLYNEPEERRRAVDAAYTILCNSHSLPAALSEAVRVLTESEQLADGAMQIEIYRRLGMHARVGDIVARISSEANETVSALREEYPMAADWLELRLMGKAPSLKDGLERGEGFLDRILTWMGTDNDDLLRQRDIEDIFTLLYEFLCGREIPMLSLRFKGDARPARALSQVNVARNTYKIATAARFSRLKAISRRLRAIQGMELDLAPSETEASELLENIHFSINKLCDSIQQDLQLQSKDRRARQRIRSHRAALKSAMDLYIELIEAHSRVEKSREKLRYALNEWEKISRKYIEQQSGRRVRRGGKSGVEIVRHYIRLRDDEKIGLARKIHHPLTDFLGRYQDLMEGGAHAPSLAYLESCQEDLKTVLINCFSAMDSYVYLGRADRQRAIEASNAPNFGSVETHLSRQTRLAWGPIVTSEIKDDLCYTAENLFRAMIAQYDVSPDDNTIDVLTDRFGARENVLLEIRESTPPSFTMPELSDPEEIPRKPVLHHSWQQIYQRARSV